MSNSHTLSLVGMASYVLEILLLFKFGHISGQKIKISSEKFMQVEIDTLHCIAYMYM